MRNYQSLEETLEINCLLDDIKKEYESSIRFILQKSYPKMFYNSHKLPKLKKIQINRGLGLAAQNTNLLKKSIEEFSQITGQKPLITKAKKQLQDLKFGIIWN